MEVAVILNSVWTCEGKRSAKEVFKRRAARWVKEEGKAAVGDGHNKCVEWIHARMFSKRLIGCPNTVCRKFQERVWGTG